MDAMPMQRLAPYWRVLVADDHRVVGEGVVRLLKDSFDDVGLVLSGQELLRSVRDGGVDIVVTDVSMGDMTGIDAMRLLRAEGHMTPFVFLSMHHDCGIVAEAIRGGASGYVLKAAAGDELLHAMDEVAAGRDGLVFRMDWDGKVLGWFGQRGVRLDTDDIGEAHYMAVSPDQKTIFIADSSLGNVHKLVRR